MRNTIKNWMLGTALIAGVIGTGATAANAAPQEFRGRPEARFDRGYARGPERGGEEFRRFERPVVGGNGYRGYGVVVGGPVVDGYIPPCPGDGYAWTAGYYNGGIWVPGAWGFRERGAGYRGFDRGYGYGRVARLEGERGRSFERGGRR